MRQIFITGTDTNIGKTTITAWLSLHSKYNYWKPIQSCSTRDDSDTITVQRLASAITYKEEYLYNQPVSPDLASKMANEVIELKKIKLPTNKNLLIEGAGGVLVPLNNNDLIIDLITHLSLPVIVVAKSGLGTINHTLLTLEALRSRNISILGVIMNGDEHLENTAAIERHSNSKVLFSFPRLQHLDREVLQSINFTPELKEIFL